MSGNPAGTAPNADAVKMTVTLWIETVEQKVIIPIFKAARAPLQVAGQPAKAGLPAPVFHMEPPHEIPAPITITVKSTQIQYSRVVPQLRRPHLTAWLGGHISAGRSGVGSAVRMGRNTAIHTRKCRLKWAAKRPRLALAHVGRRMLVPS